MRDTALKIHSEKASFEARLYNYMNDIEESSEVNLCDNKMVKAKVDEYEKDPLEETNEKVTQLELVSDNVNTKRKTKLRWQRAQNKFLELKIKRM